MKDTCHVRIVLCVIESFTKTQSSAEVRTVLVILRDRFLFFCLSPRSSTFVGKRWFHIHLNASQDIHVSPVFKNVRENLGSVPFYVAHQKLIRSILSETDPPSKFSWKLIQ